MLLYFFFIQIIFQNEFLLFIFINSISLLVFKVTNKYINKYKNNYYKILFQMVSEFKLLGAGLGTIALSGVGNGIGLIFNGLLNGVSVNPGVSSLLFNYAIIGFALTEAIALFTIMIVFLILF